MSRNLISLLPMVGDTVLIWDGLGVGVVGVGGGGGLQLPKKLLHKEKAPKNIMQSDFNGKNCAQKNCPTPEVKSILFFRKVMG